MEDYKNFVISVAREAGDILRKGHGRIHKLDFKGRTDLKNEMDMKSDALIRTRIRETYGDSIGIYSEENENFIVKGNKLKWVFDPLDGTIPYTRGFSDACSVSIALVEDIQPILGVTYAFLKDELYSAEKGKGALYNGQKLKPSAEIELNHSVVGVASGKETKNFKRAGVAKYIEQLLSPEGITSDLNLVCSSIHLCYTAKGNIDAFLALSQEPWDLAVGMLINQEAGNKISTLDGRDWNINEPSVLVANPVLHKKLLELIS